MRQWRWLGLLWLVCWPVSGLAEVVDARIEWARQVTLGVAVSGVVQRVNGQPGDRVAAGTELLTLDPTPFEAELQRARARRELATAEWQEQQRALARATELYERGVLATVELDQAKLDHARAKAALEIADSEAKLARYRLDRSRIEAPFDCWIIRRDADTGQAVSANLQPPALLVVGEADRYLARARVDAARAASLATGAAVRVQLDQRDYPARLLAVVREAPPDPGGEPRYRVDAEILTGDALLVGGQAKLVLP